MARQKKPSLPICDWKYDADLDCWETVCGMAWQFNDGGPKDNKMSFCCYCGKRLREGDRPDA